MPRLTETVDQHPDEIQAWCCYRNIPPVGKGFMAWCGYLFGLAVRIFTGPYSHVGVRLNAGIWEAVGEGVVLNDIATWAERNVVVDAITIPLTPEQKADVVQYLNAKIGTPYDYPVNLKIALAILGLPHAGIPDDLDKTLNCSGLEAHAFAHAGVNLAAMVKTGYPLWRFSPSDNWQLVKKGKAAYRGRVVFAT